MASILSTGQDDDETRMASALAGLAAPPPDKLLPPPKNRVATAPADIGVGLAQSMFPYIMGGAFQPPPPVSMTPSAAPPVEPPSPAVIGSLTVPSELPAEGPPPELPAEGPAGGKLVPPGQNPGTLGLAGDLANVAGLFAGGGEAAIAKGVGGLGALGKALFLGAGARTANKAAFAEAKAMAKAAASREEIRGATGLVQGADKKFRFEISDAASRFRKDSPTDVGVSYPLSRWYDHPELYKAYPEVAKTKVQAMSPQVAEFMGPQTSGFYDPQSATIYFNPTMGLNKARETILHEVQHRIQHLERFATGGTPAAMTKAGVRDYLRLAGEDEAYNVGRRRDYTQKKIEKIPSWETQRFPNEQQIVKFDKGRSKAIGDDLASSVSDQQPQYQ